jgi:hypothetical protein
MGQTADQAKTKLDQMVGLFDIKQLDSPDAILLNYIWSRIEPTRLNTNWGALAFNAFDASLEPAGKTGSDSQPHSHRFESGPGSQ